MVSSVPLPVSGRWFHEESLVRLFDQDLLTRDSYYVISDGELSQAAREFRQWVLRAFAGQS